MTIHLITVNSKEDASKVAHAVAVRFGEQYSINTNETNLGWHLSAELVGKRRLTHSEINIAVVLLPAYAQAFYAGLLEGSKMIAYVIQDSAGYVTDVYLGNGDEPILAKTGELRNRLKKLELTLIEVPPGPITTLHDYIDMLEREYADVNLYSVIGGKLENEEREEAELARQAEEAARAFAVERKERAELARLTAKYGAQ
jgi:hypothetical protein